MHKCNCTLPHRKIALKGPSSPVQPLGRGVVAIQSPGQTRPYTGILGLAAREHPYVA